MIMRLRGLSPSTAQCFAFWRPLLIAALILAAWGNNVLQTASAAEKSPKLKDANALIDELLNHDGTPNAATLKKRANLCDGYDRLRYLAVAEELRGDSAWRRKQLTPLLDNRREKATALADLTCLLASACVTAGDFSAARHFLEMIEAHTYLTEADIASVKASGAVRQKDYTAARREIAAGLQKLRQADKSPSGETAPAWRRRLVERRLNSVRAEVEQAITLRDGGPAYAAWVKADTARRPELYEIVIKDFPHTVFAAAATLERAGQLLDTTKPAAAAALLIKKGKKDCLAAPREVLRGDSALCLGKLKEAQKYYQNALTELKSPLPVPNDINAELRKKLTPEKPLHRWDEWHNNTWYDRPAGTILIPAASPENLAWWRYNTLLRLSVALYLQGDQEAAALTAMMVDSFDMIDREMAAEENIWGSAGVLLRQIYRDGNSQTVPLEFLNHVPMPIKTQLLAGLVFYHAYNFRESYHWFTRALAHPQLKGLSRDGALLGAGWAQYLASKDKTKALELLRQVKHFPGHPTNEIWYLAKNLEGKIIVGKAENMEEFAIAAQKQTEILKAVYQKLGKRNIHAFWACHNMAVCNSVVNPALSRKYYQELLTFDQSVLTDDLKKMVHDSLKRLDEEAKRLIDACNNEQVRMDDVTEHGTNGQQQWDGNWNSTKLPADHDRNRNDRYCGIPAK